MAARSWVSTPAAWPRRSTKRSGNWPPAPMPTDYAQAVEALFARDIEAIGRAAREKAVSQFAWNRVFEDLCMVYGELTGEAAFVTPDEALPLH